MRRKRRPPRCRESSDPRNEPYRSGLEAESIPLGDLARKTTSEELARFLMDPVKIRPSGRMPGFGLSKAEARSLAVYLLREQLANPANGERQAYLPGLRYHYYEDHLSGSPDFSELTPKASGTVGNFSAEPRQREQSFGFRYSGSIRIPESGEYAFFVNSDDGSQLFIDGKLVIDNNGDHAPIEKQETITLPAGEHGIVLTFFNNGGGHELRVSWSGPGFTKEEIPAAVLSHIGRPMVPLGSVDFAVEQAKAERGRELFGSLGCAACHQVSGAPVENNLRAKALAELDAGSEEGCLAESPGPRAPKFDFSEAQRDALKDVVKNRRALRDPFPPAKRIAFTMAQLNCYACHTRDAEGGPVDARLAFFRVEGEIDMGDEGRIPPHLTGVGAKLRKDWMRRVLLDKGWVRPYMSTRMPQFGEANVGALPELFERVDLGSPAEIELESTPLQAKYGRRLVGTGGLSCISCHTFGEYASLGIPAIDLTTMAGRLRYGWFHSYLINPPGLRPGTRMPSFWPEGEAVNQEVLDGDTEAQIEAIWAYLSQGGQADVPDGLIQGEMEIVAETEPVIYRNFIEGAGTRAIGVGYPEKVNLAFDANNMRVAMIWQGAFIDAARHSTGRGAGFEPPLGHNVRHLPEGAPFAFLEGLNPPWPKESGKAAGYRMIGYTLDEQRRPVFRYAYRGVQIDDYFAPIIGEVDNHFRRTLTFRSGQPVADLYYRAAMGSSIERQGDNEFLVGGRMTLRFSGDAAGQAVIRGEGGGQELLVPIETDGTEGTLVEEIIW